jgi:hypothetical protein
MKNIWKWILGVALVLLVVAGLAGLVFVFHNRAANFAYRTMLMTPGSPAGMSTPQPSTGGAAATPQALGPDARGWRGPMMGGRFQGGPGAMMRGRGFGSYDRGMPFGPGFMIIGGLMRLVPLALLVVLLVIAYRLGKRENAHATSPVAPIPAVAPTLTHVCAECGNNVQNDWKHCPNCGAKQQE